MLFPFLATRYSPLQGYNQQQQKELEQCAFSWSALAPSADISAAECLQAGRDVTFLVRPRRAAELAAAGLVIKSPNGDVTLKNPPTVQADKLERQIRRRAVELQGIRPRGCDQVVRAGGRAERPRSSRCSTACFIWMCSTGNSDVSACSAASARSRSRSTRIARSFSSRRCSRSVSASATANCRTGFAPSRK